MMKINELIKQPEGRRLEFKESLPTSADLTKTIVAFANDAGGELLIGIKNEPRELVGLPENELMQSDSRPMLSGDCAGYFVSWQRWRAIYTGYHLQRQ
jgi:predicted HTH transcriptional regulator